MRSLASAAIVLLLAGCSAADVGAPGTATPAASPTATRSTNSGGAVAKGTITGRVSYPSDHGPALAVYAFDVNDRSRYFSVDTEPWAGGAEAPRYTLAVPAGTYHVVAYIRDATPDPNVRPGLYSQAVLCGLSAGCTDHGLIGVTVGAGTPRSGIDPTDWYYPQGTSYPARPR